MSSAPAWAADHAVSRRLMIAVGLSLLAHYWVASVWRGGVLQATVSPTAIAARLAVPAAPAEVLWWRAASVTGVVPASPTAATPAETGQSQLARPVPQLAQSVVTTAQPGPDMRIYLARELDHYPVPVAAWALNGESGSVRLWVSIDQIGQVTDVAVIAAEPPSAFDAVARERLLGMRFSPAYKDDRPVKSRVLLVLHGF